MHSPGVLSNLRPVSDGQNQTDMTSHEARAEDGHGPNLGSRQRRQRCDGEQPRPARAFSPRTCRAGDEARRADGTIRLVRRCGWMSKSWYLVAKSRVRSRTLGHSPDSGKMAKAASRIMRFASTHPRSVVSVASGAVTAHLVDGMPGGIIGYARQLNIPSIRAPLACN